MGNGTGLSDDRRVSEQVFKHNNNNDDNTYNRSQIENKSIKSVAKGLAERNREFGFGKVD